MRRQSTRLRFETLETRNLFAADFGGVEVAPVASPVTSLPPAPAIELVEVDAAVIDANAVEVDDFDEVVGTTEAAVGNQVLQAQPINNLVTAVNEPVLDPVLGIDEVLNEFNRLVGDARSGDDDVFLSFVTGTDFGSDVEVDATTDDAQELRDQKSLSERTV